MPLSTAQLLRRTEHAGTQIGTARRDRHSPHFAILGKFQEIRNGGSRRSDLGMRKLGPTAAEELLEIIMRRYERASTVLTSNRPVEDWGKLLGDSAAVTAMLDRLLHHGHILKCGPQSWRTGSQTEPSTPKKP